MKAQCIHDTNLEHQCARCTRSYPRMYRHQDGLVYCSEGDVCRAEPPRQTKATAIREASGAKAGAKPKAAKKKVAKKATRPKRRSRT